MISFNFLRHKRIKTRGQSLVELAISLPLFLMLIGGIVEVGNLLVQRQRITTASDMGVRFGSRGGSDTGIYISTYNVLTQTMPIDNPELWDIFVIRGKVNGDGTGWSEFDSVHVFGGQATELYSDLISTTYPITLQTEILDGLQARASRDAATNEILEILPAGGGPGQSGNDGLLQAADEEIVGVVMSHHAETILGLQDYFGQDFEMRTQKYMTVHTVGDQTNGCDLYPIAISNGARNILPGRNLDAPGENYYLHTSSGYDAEVDPIGNLSQYNYPVDDPNDPTDLPHWIDFRVTGGARGVLSNDQGVPEAREGDIYILYEGEHFEWIFWDDSTTTAGDMAWPGNSDAYQAYNTFPNADPGLHVNDRVKHATNNPLENNEAKAAGAYASLQAHIDKDFGRPMRFPVVEIGASGNLDSSTSDNFKIAGFVILKIHGYGDGINQHAGKKFIVAEVVRVDTSCGQDANR